MKKRYLASCFIALLFILSGCQQNEDNRVNEPKNTIVVGTLNHGITDAESIASQDEGFLLRYSGEEISVNYDIQVTGEINEVGLLIFVDGIAQPYKTNVDAAYRYMHVFPFASGEDNIYFTLLFVPVTGSINSESTVTVLSLTSPNSEFDPTDPKSVGQGIVQVEFPIYFDETPTPVNYDYNTAYQAITYNKFDEKITPDISEELESAGMWAQLLLNDTPAADMELEDDNLHIKYEIYDMDKVPYRTTFYLNHVPISYERFTSFQSNFTENNKDIFSLAIDSAALEESNMLYAISIPLESKAFNDNVKLARKTDTVLIQRGK